MDRISDSGSEGCGSIPHGGTKKASSNLRRLDCVPGNTLTAFCLFCDQAVPQTMFFNLFFDTPRSLFAHNLAKVYC